MTLHCGACLWCGKRDAPLDDKGLCGMCGEPKSLSRVGEMNPDVMDCGDPETSLHETIRHFRWRAQCEAAVARDLRQTASAAKADADEHRDRAEGFLQLAKALERLPIAFPASGMEAPSGGETTKIGSTEGDSPTSQSEGMPKSHPLSSGDEV